VRVRLCRDCCGRWLADGTLAHGLGQHCLLDCGRINRRVGEGISLITSEQLYWAAGFLEGEGSFLASSAACRSRPNRKTFSLRVVAMQVQTEPLERLQRMFGGKVCIHTDNRERRPNWSPCFKWIVHGTRAAAIMLTLWSIMSPRRKRQIEDAIVKWKTNRSQSEGCKEGAPKGWVTRRSRIAA